MEGIELKIDRLGKEDEVWEEESIGDEDWEGRIGEGRRGKEGDDWERKRRREEERKGRKKRRKE